jgi:hypothetical protein
MYKIIRTFSRPTTNVEFWGPENPLVSDDFRTYRKETYVDTGKLVSRTHVLSADGLSGTITAMWESPEDLQIFLNDQRVINELETPGEQYMTENGIHLVDRSSQII